MAESNLGPQWRHLAVVLRGEKAITTGARKALAELLAYTQRALASGGYDPTQLSAAASGWLASVGKHIDPAVAKVFLGSFDAAARAVIDPAPYSVAHLGTVRNRLVGVPDEVFHTMRGELEAGRQAGEGIAQLAARVDLLLSDEQRWTNRAVTIARTETIGAANAGGHASARASAELLGEDPAYVVKEWMATSDGRTRETHLEVDGFQVVGLDTPFTVGDSDLQYAADPDGDAGEVVNCRCTTLYHYPGDPDYPDEFAPDAEVLAMDAASDAPYTTGPADVVDPGPQTAAEHAARTMTPEELAMETKTRGGMPQRAAKQELARRGLTAAGEDVPTDAPVDGEAPVAVQPTVVVATDLAPNDADTTLTTEDCPCGDLLVFDTSNGWQRLDGSYSHDDGTVHSDWVLPPTAEELASVAPTDTAPTDDEVAAAMRVLQAFTARTPLQAADAPLPEDQPAPEGTPAVAQDIPADGDPFHGILWPEATLSGDGRMIEAQATVWRDLPLPLMAQDAQMPGHDGAVRVGRIDTIERDATTYAVPVLRYTGVWDTSPAAVETARQVGAGVARGVSVDGDDLTVELRGSDGQPLDPMVDDFPEDGVVVESATAARVAGATVCSIPAFQQAYVANGPYVAGEREPGWNSDGTPLATGQVPEGSTPAEGDAEDPLVVMASAWSLVASAGPVWAVTDFANPGLETPTRLTVTDDGRVYGHLATWGVCHIGIDGVCQEPPVSATNYAYFATGAVQTDAGLASVGTLTMDTGHAPMPARFRAAAAHYDNTGSAVADVAMGQDAVGIWFSGRLRPGTTPEQVYAMRAAGSVSGDWREVGGQLELVAALVVNCPGFPIPAPSVAASGARPTAMVASGVVRPAERPDTTRVQDFAGRTLRELPSYDPADLTAAVETVLAARDLRARATTAASRLRTHRAQEARRRLAVHQTRRATAALARIEGS